MKKQSYNKLKYIQDRLRYLRDADSHVCVGHETDECTCAGYDELIDEVDEVIRMNFKITQVQKPDPRFCKLGDEFPDSEFMAPIITPIVVDHPDAHHKVLPPNQGCSFDEDLYPDGRDFPDESYRIDDCDATESDIY